MTEMKAFGVKIPKELWAFLKKRSVDTDMTMNDIIEQLLKKAKEKHDKRLTDTNL